MRDQYWDLVKGVAIITVVLGHCGGPSVPLAYIINYFHMALFFFISGALYKDSNSKDPLRYFGKKLQSTYYPAVKYFIAYILLHNLFIRLNVYSSAVDVPMVDPKNIYSPLDMISQCLKAIFFSGCEEEMAGAMWFIYPLMVSLFIFCTVKYIISWVKDTVNKELITAIISILIGSLGLLFLTRSIHLTWRSELGMLCVPVVYCGYLLKTYGDSCVKKPKWYIALPCVGMLVYLYFVRSFEISFAAGIVTEPVYFYVATLCGIYCCLFIARLIGKIPTVSSVISYLGSISFHIMALHFLAFKVVNCIDVVVYQKPSYLIAAFPYSNSNWWYLNLCSGLAIPAILVLGYRHGCDLIAKKWMGSRQVKLISK